MTLDCTVVALFVMTVAGMAVQYEDAVGSLTKCLHHELRVDPAAAHHADYAHVGWIGRL